MGTQLLGVLGCGCPPLSLACWLSSDTEDDRIVVRFDLESVDSGGSHARLGLHAYMNVLTETGDIPTRFGLVRVTEDWHSTPADGFLYYMWRAPWTRPRPTDPYLAKRK